MSVKYSDPNGLLIIIGILATGSFFDNGHLDVSRLKGQICQAIYFLQPYVWKPCVY